MIDRCDLLVSWGRGSLGSDSPPRDDATSADSLPLGREGGTSTEGGVASCRRRGTDSSIGMVTSRRGVVMRVVGGVSSCVNWLSKSSKLGIHTGGSGICRVSVGTTTSVGGGGTPTPPNPPSDPRILGTPETAPFRFRRFRFEPRPLTSGPTEVSGGLVPLVPLFPPQGSEFSREALSVVSHSNVPTGTTVGVVFLLAGARSLRLPSWSTVGVVCAPGCSWTRFMKSFLLALNDLSNSSSKRLHLRSFSTAGCGQRQG